MDCAFHIHFIIVPGPYPFEPEDLITVVIDPDNPLGSYTVIPMRRTIQTNPQYSVHTLIE